MDFVGCELMGSVISMDLLRTYAYRQACRQHTYLTVPTKQDAALEPYEIRAGGKQEH